LKYPLGLFIAVTTSTTLSVKNDLSSVSDNAYFLPTNKIKNNNKR